MKNKKQDSKERKKKNKEDKFEEKKYGQENIEKDKGKESEPKKDIWRRIREKFTKQKSIIEDSSENLSSKEDSKKNKNQQKNKSSKKSSEETEDSQHKKLQLSPRTKILSFIFFDLVITSLVFLYKKNIILSIVTFLGIILLSMIYKILKKKLNEAARIKEMEATFPDFLQLVSSNLRAGMTIDRALILSAREEFAPLDKEIKSVGKDIVTGKELGLALNDMAKRTKSDKIEKTVGLIVRGLRSGGNLSILLEQISGNMRERDYMEKKASSNVLMYVIFIFFAVAFGAPVLFGLSSIMVEVLTDMVANVPDMGSSIQTSFTIQEVNISVDFVIYFSLVFMIVIDILASLILGLVHKGKEKEGIKFIPPILIISLTIYFVVRIFLSNFMSGFFG